MAALQFALLANNFVGKDEVCDLKPFGTPASPTQTRAATLALCVVADAGQWLNNPLLHSPGGDQCIIGEPQGGAGHGAFTNPMGGPYAQRMMAFPKPGLQLGKDYGPGA